MLALSTFRTVLATSVAIPLFAVAAPVMGQVVNAGDLQGSYDSAGNPGQIVITNPNASTANVRVLAPVVVANWNQFNVPVNTTLNVTKDPLVATAQASLLNRVIGGNFSDIGGTINAAGVNLWLVNQNGILFGSNASVNASSFYASTLDLTDADFFDFYEGTDNAGNGAGTIRFQTNPFATTFIVAFGGTTSSPTFATDGTLMFIGPALNLTGTFDAGTGKASFVTATDVAVSFNAGSPVSYTINAGTTVASQLIDGSVTGGSAEFVFQTASGVMNGLLTVDADVATNASATNNGIFLYAGGSLPTSIATNGTLQSSGGIAAQTNGNLKLAQNAQGSAVSLQAAGSVMTAGVTATSGGIDIDSTGAKAISVGALSAATDIAIDTSGGKLSGTTVNAGGAFTVGAFADPTPVTFTGNISAGSVDIESGGALTVRNVTATAGKAELTAMGALTADAISATGAVTADTTGAITFASVTANSDGIGAEGVSIGNTTLPSSVQVTGATSGGFIDIQSAGNLTFGNVVATSGVIDLDSTVGAIAAGAVSASGGAAMLTAPGAVTTGSISSTDAIDVGSTSGGNLNLGNLGAGTTIALDTSGSIAFGSANAGGVFAIGGTVDPSSITATGHTQAASIDFDSRSSIAVQNVTATSAGIQMNAAGATGDISAREIRSNVSTIFLSAGRDITTGDLSTSLASATDPTAGSIGLHAGRSIVTGNAIAGEDLHAVAGGAFTAGQLVAGDDILIDASTDITVAGARTTGAGSDATALSFVGAAGSSAPSFAAENRTGSNVQLVSTLGSISGGVIDKRGFGGAVVLRARTGIATTSIASLGGIDVDSTAGGTLDLGNLNAMTTIALDTTNALRFGNVKVGSGLLNIGATAVPLSITTTGTIDAITLSARTTGGIDFSGANRIMALGTVTAGGPVVINSVVGLAVNGLVTAIGQDVTLKTTGDITLNSGGGVTGKVVALSAGGNFVNNRGADAIAASDRWVVYSNAPAGNTFGNLDSGNTAIWNATIATLAPGAVSGNRYIFAYQPTLTVSSTSLSKVYGTDLTGMLDGYYNVSGFQPGVAGAYLADTAANTLSGAPTVTSAGAAERADVAGSPYVMDVELGTVAASRGYAIVLSDAGTLTVTPKPVSASVEADDKTYDGSTVSTGSISSSGFLSGDDVTIIGTTYSFSDKNVGVDKTVTISGATLSGTDAGNYTLTVPTSTLADIIAKAIGATVMADDKIYDGTTAGTGSLTLNGVVAGDELGTSGTTFTFSDKNAGPDKTVTVSGTTLTGADAGNYVLTVPTTTLADIFARTIGATVTANNKTYDGTTAATGSLTLNGVIGGDSVGTSGTSFAFTDKNAGTDKKVTASGTTLTGADAGNYTLTGTSTALANILAKAITGSVTVNDKVYDGTTAASGIVTLTGVIAGDAVSTTGTTFTFVDPNAGTDKTVRVGGTALAGADSGNYTLTLPATALADILKRAIEIVAVDGAKFQGQFDPALNYSVGGAGLVTGDALTGALERAPGEIVGTYAIGQGSLTAGANYTITFAGGTFTIRPTPVPNTLRTTRMPSEIEGLSSGSGVSIQIEELCPDQDEKCTN